MWRVISNGDSTMKPKKILLNMLVPLIFIPVLIWFQQIGDLGVYFDGTAPLGQLSYVLSKLVGMLALVLIAGQVIFSLCHHLKLLNIQWLGRTHFWFGTTILLFAFSHLLLFFTAVTFRQDALAFSLFLPDFRDFYHTHLTFGLFGLWLLIAVAGIGWLRRKNRYQWIAKFHRLYWIAIVLIYFHALAVGSESQSSAGLLLYSFLGLIMLILGVWSLVRIIKVKRVVLL
jgi:predicted ferric reductase